MITLLDYFCALGVERLTEPGKRKAFLIVSIGANLGFLGFFKYYNFLATNLAHAVGLPEDSWTAAIVLPIGISFHTFQGISYTVDVYRGRIPAVRNFVDFALFVAGDARKIMVAKNDKLDDEGKLQYKPRESGELTGGNFGAIGGSVSVTGGLTDQVAGRLFVAHRERDGFYDVNNGDGPNTRKDDQNQDYWTTRGQLLILPSDDVSVRLIADYTKREEYCCVAVQTRVGPTQAFIAALTAPNGPGQRPPVAGFGTVPFSRDRRAS